MSTAAMKDPIEVIEMRESLKEFGRVVRSARESHRWLQRPSIAVEKKLVEREDETTKKTASDR